MLFGSEIDLCMIEVLREEVRNALVEPVGVHHQLLAVHGSGAGQPQVVEFHLAVRPGDVPVGLVASPFEG